MEQQKCDNVSCEFNEHGICFAGHEEHCGIFGTVEIYKKERIL